MFRLPNLISLARVVAAPVVCWLLYTHRYREALAVLLIAGFSDWLDGFMARRLGMTNQVGVVLDPLADKVLMVFVFVCLGLLGLLPWWLFVLVIARDLVIVIGALLLRILRNRREFFPSLVGKVSTFFQIALALVAVTYAAFPYAVFEWLKLAGVGLAALFTIWSGIEYVRRGIEMARARPIENN